MKRTALLGLIFIVSANASLPAQTFSLLTGREPVTSLDGLWRFHTGDNPAWAGPSFDDSSWPLLRSDESWDAQGYKGYGGFAWYRFTIEDPQGYQPLSLLLTSISTSYRVYADGSLIGGYGYLPPQTLTLPSIPAAFDLPRSSRAGPRTIHIALRVWQDPTWAYYAPGGALRPGNLAGRSPLILQRLSAEKIVPRLRGVNVYAYSVLAALFGLLVLGLYLFRPAEREYLWFALVLLASAADAVLNFAFVIHSLPVEVFDYAEGGIVAIFQIAAILFFSMVLRARRNFWWWFACIAASLTAFSTFLYTLRFSSVPVSGAVEVLLLLPSQLWILVVLIRRAVQRDADARLLFVPVLLAFGFIVADNLTIIAYQIGWQRRTFTLDLTLFENPYRLGLRALVFSIFAFAMMLFLIRRFSLARRSEARLAAEVQAARTVQQVLIPDEIPTIPGFALQSVYRPAGEVGGDFFQFLPSASGGVLAVIGDVSGKGMPAAMTVSLLVGTFRTLAHYTQSPSEILDAMNQRMRSRSNGGFTTCLVLRANPDGVVTRANAGHLAPYRNGEEIPIESGLPLGIALDGIYSESTINLSPGDHLTFLSDGVVEAQSSTGELFGFDRTQAISTQSAEQIADAAQRWGQEDDITVLSVTLTAKLQEATA